MPHCAAGPAGACAILAEKLKLAALILAAGGSTRLGTAKQLLRIGKETLLQRSVRLCASLPVDSIHVVLGAQAEACLHDLGTTVASCCINPEWQEGMGHSLAFGTKRIAGESDAAALMVLHVDQYRVRSAGLVQLIEAWREAPEHLVAAAYADTAGPPAIFPRALFPLLQDVTGEGGAKRLVLRPDTRQIAMPEAACDVDTPDDLERLTRFATRKA